MKPSFSIKVKSRNVRYLWMKYVREFKQTEHCAKCLLGPYSRFLPYGRQAENAQYSGELTEHESKFIYLCAVTPKWETNVHIAMKVNPYKRTPILHECEFLTAAFIGVEEVKIIKPSIEEAPEFWKLPQEFATCRNFQFGFREFVINKR